MGSECPKRSRSPDPELPAALPAGRSSALVTFRFNGYEPERNYGHFELHAERRADDLGDGKWFLMVGKGVLDCATPPVTLGLMFLGSG